MVETSFEMKGKALEAFQRNVATSVVCDKCLQPIDAAHSSQSLLQLKSELTTISDQREHVVKVRGCVKSVCMNPALSTYSKLTVFTPPECFFNPLIGRISSLF